MKKHHTVKFIDHVANIEKFGILIGVITLIPLIFIMLVHLLESFNIFELFMILLVIILLLVLLCTIPLINITNEKLEQITITEDELLIVFYKYNQKHEVIFNKSEIKSFHVHFNADCFQAGNKLYLEYATDIKISSINENIEMSFDSYTKNIIKNMFKIAKYIPNFSYTVDKYCLPVIEESIKKISITGKDLNFFEFIKFMFTSPKVSIRTKLDTLCCILLIIPVLIFFILMFINMEICDNFMYRYGEYVPYYLIPLIVFITLLRMAKR